MKRFAIALLTVPVAFAVAATPAHALSPKDAKGCENNNASQLDKYCESDGG